MAPAQDGEQSRSDRSHARIGSQQRPRTIWPSPQHWTAGRPAGLTLMAGAALTPMDFKDDAAQATRMD